MQNYTQRLLVGVSVSLLLLLIPNHASAGTNVFWDNSGTSPATAGTWDNSSPNWAPSSTLTTSTFAFTNGDFPEFSGGTATTPLTITVNSAVVCAGMYARTTSPLTISGTGSIGISTNSGNLVNGGLVQGFLCTGSIVIYVPLTGAGGVEQEVNASLALYGNNTYSGGTDLTGGQVTYYNNSNSFGTGAIYIGGTGQALVSGLLAAITIPNNVVFAVANYEINLAGGNPVGGAPGTTFSGNFTLPSSGNINFEMSSTATEVIEISGVISGASGIIVNDAGTLELGGLNTFTGATTVSNPATLIIVGSGNLGNSGGSGNYSKAITNTSTFIYNSTAAQILSGTISGTGNFIQSGPGILSITGSGNTYTGSTIVSNGILQAAYDRSLGADPGSVQATNIILAGGTLQGVSPSIGNFAFAPNRGITLTANSGLSAVANLNLPAPQNGELGIQGIITDNGSGYGITITGTTNLTTRLVSGVYLEGVNTYFGPTVIQSGILSLYYNGSINNSSSISIAPGAALDVSSEYPANYPWTLNQPLIASGSALGLPGFGTVAPTTAAIMIATNTGTVSFASESLFLNFTPTTFTGDAIHPSLYLSQGLLAVNGNNIAVTNLGTSPLGFGSYTLIQQAQSGGITVSSPPNLSGGIVYGNGIVADGAAAISVSGGTVSLVVYPTDTSTFFINLTPSPSSTYGAGGNITLTGTVVSTNGGVAVYPNMGDTVNITIPGVNSGNPVAVHTTDASGDFTYTFAAPTLGAGGYAISYNYPAGQSLNPGASATDTSTALMVGQAPLTITANSQTINYGAAVPAGTVTYTGFVNGETNTALTTQPTISSSKSGTNNAAGTTANNYTPAFAYDPNYAISYVSGNLTINPVPLVITAASKTITYGTTVPAGTVTYSGFVLGQTNTALTTQPTVASSQSGSSVLVGTYPGNYTASGAVDANYTISYVPGNLTVNIAVPFSITNRYLDGLGHIILGWQSSPGATYQVVGATSLFPPITWTNVGSPVAATSTNTSATNALGSSVNFYSVTTTN